MIPPKIEQYYQYQCDSNMMVDQMIFDYQSYIDSLSLCDYNQYQQKVEEYIEKHHGDKKEHFVDNESGLVFKWLCLTMYLEDRQEKLPEGLIGDGHQNDWQSYDDKRSISLSEGIYDLYITSD